MAERKRIGLIYSYSEDWIGGAYYIQNLISALNYIDDIQKPVVVLFFSDENRINEIQKIQYPYIEYINYKPLFCFFARVINFLSRKLFNTNPIYYKAPENLVDIIYPASLDNPHFLKIPKKVYWIPDFQERYFPEFFSAEKISERNEMYKQYIRKKCTLIFSSHSALNDFNSFFPEHRNSTHVLRFAVSHPSQNEIDTISIRKRYGVLDTPYFFVANQFWAHKNHLCVLKAINKLKGLNFKVLFSGAPTDPRNPSFFSTLEAYLDENNLRDYVQILGFVERKIQLGLMKDSIAIIQPSLFEGWSTVVEDAKALNKFILLSNLKVHLEQINKNVVFFDPYNSNELADAMKSILEILPPLSPIDYRNDILKFANDFIEIMNLETAT